MKLRTPDAATTPSSPRGRRRLLPAAIVVLAAGAAGGLAWRHAGGRADAGAAAPALPATADAPAAPPAPRPVAAVAPAASAPAGAAPAAGWRPPPPPDAASPAELLHTVQKGLDVNGSPEAVLAAASALTACARFEDMARKLAEAGLAGQTARDLAPQMPPDLRKRAESWGAFSRESIERSERQQRACQAIDTATLARRGELYQRAYEGDPARAAKAYLLHLTFESPPDKPDGPLLARLRADVRRTAESGDIASLAGWAFSGDLMAQQMASVWSRRGATGRRTTASWTTGDRAAPPRPAHWRAGPRCSGRRPPR